MFNLHNKKIYDLYRMGKNLYNTESSTIKMGISKINKLLDSENVFSVESDRFEGLEASSDFSGYVSSSSESSENISDSTKSISENSVYTKSVSEKNSATSVSTSDVYSQQNEPNTVTTLRPRTDFFNKNTYSTSSSIYQKRKNDSESSISTTSATKSSVTESTTTSTRLRSYKLKNI